MGDGRLSNVIVAGSWLTLLSLIVVVIAFATPHWLETDGMLEDPKFIKLGLWTVCFENFEDRLHFYDIKFSGCRWVLDEEYQIIDYMVRPPFFIAVQLFFTLCFILVVVGSGLVVVAVCCMDGEREATLLRLVFFVLIGSAVCGTIAVITFGVLGDSRSWMPDYDHNNLSWSFGLAAVGTVLNYFAAIMFWVEARRENKKDNFGFAPAPVGYQPSSEV